MPLRVSFAHRLSLRSVEPFSSGYFLDLYRPWPLVFNEQQAKRKKKHRHLYTLRIVDSLILVKPSEAVFFAEAFCFSTGF
jgi:hypothetical protein